MIYDLILSVLRHAAPDLLMIPLLISKAPEFLFLPIVHSAPSSAPGWTPWPTDRATPTVVPAAVTTAGKRKSGNSSMAGSSRAGRRNNGGGGDVQLSKSLSWVLRHSARSLGLRPLPDGYVPVRDVLALDHPRFRDRRSGRRRYGAEDVVRVVEGNDKRRFRLEYRDVDDAGRIINDATADGDDRADDGAGKGGRDNGNDSSIEDDGGRVLCIRANQGHSLKGIQADKLLTPMTPEELSSPDLTVVHGTTRRAWEDHIRREGLSRMKRNHIHFASALPSSAAKRKLDAYEKKKNDAAPISGMRSSSEVYIYINGPKCAVAGIPFYRSDNGVILTAGVDQREGMLPLEYLERVVCASSGKVIWEPDANADATT